ncbi:hypothetical protein [Variovorax sp. JS1663]|uniref:hypothetical protein n=1 Tax=Variovorax sp. JS1663 TaxID=1851577 RepID=UPI000B343B9C|nr:hypothetical protein [Variovorax sp. JS1663]OUM00023.1 hypothetical protein A8M77_23640 [Variovorax sp. JS1663]
MPQNLTQTDEASGHPLAINGRQLVASHEQIVSILSSRLGQAHADLLAVPKPGDGGTVVWSTRLPGDAVLASALPADERDKLERWSRRLLNDIRSLGEQLRSEGQASALVGQMLESAIRVPEGDWLYSVGGKPVLAMWGHSSAPEASATVPVAAAVAEPPPAVASTVGSPAAAVGAGRDYRRWLLGGLLLLLLVAVVLFGLKRCGEMTERSRDYASKMGEAEAANKALEEEIAKTRAQTPQFMCVRPPEEPPPAAPESPKAQVEEPPAAKPETPAKPEAPPKRAELIRQARNMCPGQRPKELAPEMVLVFDASGSMSFSVDATDEEIQRMASLEAVHGMMQQFLGGRAGPGVDMSRLKREPTRMTSARQAAIAAVRRAPSDANIGLVLVDQCPAARSAGFYPPARRGELLSGLESIQPRQGTPLADGVAKGGKLVDGVSREALMVVISDGRESCNQDPCAVARSLARAKPYLKINVVDITGTGAGNCLAQATGGKVFTARNASEVAAMTRRAAEDAMGPANCPKP